MLIYSLTSLLEKCRPVVDTFRSLDRGENPLFATPPAARPLVIAAAFARNPRPMLVVIAGEDAAKRMALSLSLYLGRDTVMQLPLHKQLPWSQADEPAQTAGQRLRALAALANGHNVVVVASVRALMRRLPPKSQMVFSPLCIEPGMLPDGLEYEQLPFELERLGYHREDAATEKGTFALHGDTLDVYSADSNHPVRIEFFGDEVERIRRIIPSTGQTVEDLASVSMFPAREIMVTQREVSVAKDRLSRAGLLTNEMQADLDAIAEFGIHGAQQQYIPFLFDHTDTPMDYAHPSTLTVMIEPRSLFDDSSRYHDELQAAARQTRASLEGLFSTPHEMRFDNTQMLSVLSLIRANMKVENELEAKVAEGIRSMERFMAQVRSLLSRGHTVVLAVTDRGMRDDLELALTDEHIPIVEHFEETPRFSHGVVNIVDTPIPQPLVLPHAKLALLGASDALAAGSDAVRTSTKGPVQVTFPYKPGDYVVHQRHGVARFTHMERQEVDGIWRDYLVLEYAGADKLYIPVEQIGKITKYVGSAGTEPHLTRLNTNDWARAQKKASKAARKLAFDLVDLYVRRSAVQGHAFAHDTDMQVQMEALFPYEETTDQARAIADVKADMESTRPMDRLICGDVGFGKTEVAIRAAFKAVQDGKQVMVLCPTTILAQQHYTTFAERFADFPVNVDILSRFRTAAQQRQTLEGFAQGTVDVLIGTHRLLSHDVSPKSLGLVIIDEEQRFGVKHKEQLKNLREQIDVLTMTATPIPRTLQMSLGGVRDMSVIDTPPSFRIPVEVHVGEWDDGVVSGAIRREIQRGGQVYYVSTRIADIDDAIERVTQAVPEARVGFAHGRMKEAQLEDVMERFSAGEIDVLVSTTIIESGLDNPHTNTLIIEDAHMLGLAQLYQLKGRVGRSRVQAFAYFMFPPQASLTQDAIDRLVAIQEHQDFGSGIKIAMRDLEIRGAGSLLGSEQSGNISAIGFEAFTAMLADYVDEARGNAPLVLADTVIDLPADVFISEEYVPAADQRVQLYRDFAAARSREEVLALAESMSRAFGPPPLETRNLVSRAHLQVIMRQLGIATITCQNGKVTVQPIDLDARGRAAAQQKGALYFVKSRKLTYRLPALGEGEDRSAFDQVLEVLRAIGDAMGEEDEADAHDDDAEG